jgi:GntR family transcriptional regulator
MATATPKYRRVADSLASDIAAGQLKAGDRLPSERTLAEAMGISRMTARQALRHLTERGIVTTRVGHGSFVGVPAIQQELASLTGFTEEMERQGRHAASIVVEAARRPPEPGTADALDLSAGAEVWRIARIRFVDGQPVAIETTEVAADIAPDLLDRADLGRSSLYATLRAHYGLRPATAEQSLAAAVADPSVALPLGLPVGAPVLRLTRLTRDAEGRAFEHVRSVYRGDVFVMKVRLHIPETAA